MPEQQFDVSIRVTLDNMLSPEAAAAAVDAWLRDGGLNEAVYAVESEDGSLNRVRRSANDGWKIVEL
jgi:hypothetical protein